MFSVLPRFALISFPEMASVKIKTADKLTNLLPAFLSCEHLIAENGSILFSSNQLKENIIALENLDFSIEEMRLIDKISKG